MKIAIVYLNGPQHVCVNQGPGWLASVLLDAGHDVELFDTLYSSIDETARAIARERHGAVLLSASTLFYDYAKEMARAIASDVPVVLGGLHATLLGAEILDDCAEIDYVCVGEGEGFALDFVQALEAETDPTAIANLGYRDGTTVVNPPRPCTDLGSLPRFRYDLWSPESVVQPYPLPGFCYVYATRGCPYKCTYCCNSSWLELYGRSYLRTRPVDSVIEELLRLKAEYPVRFFYFGDEMILFDATYVSDLFTRVKREIQLPYGCMARVEWITPEIVDLFTATGCGYVGMGVECGDEGFRREFLNRRMTNERIIQAFRDLRRVPSIKLTAHIMVNYPVPNDAELERTTHKLLAKCRPDIVGRNVFYPFPGTRLHDYCVERDLIDQDKARGVTDVTSTSVLR